ncbi:hypothetical protein HUU62_08795 [Rhodoferax sp. 4810]|nr:hypothetical protein [Rhodoferax jenense]
MKLEDHEYSVDDKGILTVINNGIARFYLKRDYALTEEDAIQQVNEMKRKRIDSLLRQIAKLENKPIKMK